MTIRSKLGSCALAAAFAACVPAPALAAPGWLAPVPILRNFDEFNLQPPAVASNARGDTAVAWVTSDGSGDEHVNASVRPAGGSFSAPVAVGPASSSWQPQVAIDDDGDTTVAWTRPGEDGTDVAVAERPAGGSFGPAISVSGTDVGALLHRLSVNPAGDAVIAWRGGPSPTWAIRVLTRSRNGTVNGPDVIADAFQADVAIDRTGKVLVAWGSRSTGVATVAERSQAGTFSAPTPISTPGQRTYALSVAVGDGGAAIAAWHQLPAPDVVVPTSAVRPAGGAFEAPQPLDEAYEDSGDDITVAMNAKGDAVVAWERLKASTFVPLARTRPAGGAFSAPATPFAASGQDPSVAITPAGDAFVAWWDRPLDRGRAARAPAGGAFGPAQDLAAPFTDTSTGGGIAADGLGNATAVWAGYEIPPDGAPIIGSTTFDGAGPVFGAVSVPDTARPGAPVAMSAEATDALSPPATLGFDFGDGTSAAGGAVSHTYVSAGTYTVTIKATDPHGNATTATRTISVADPPLNVTPITNPQPRPAGPTTAQILAELKRRLVPSGSAAKLAKLAKAKRYRVTYKALTAGTATITWSVKAKGKTVVVGKGTRRFTAAGSAPIDIKLTSKGLKLVKRAKRLQLTATSTFAVTGKAPVSAKKTITLKR